MKILSLVIAISLISFSCTEFLLGPDIENTPKNNFELMWKEIDAYYPSFVAKNIDWNLYYNHYLQYVNSETTEDELWRIMSQMILPLRDVHVYMYNRDHSKFATSNPDYLFPPFEFSLQLVMVKYLKYNYHTAGNSRFTYGKLNNKTGYIHLSDFGGETEWYKDINSILNSLSDVESVILDLRDNEGGLYKNFSYIASRFAAGRTVYAKEITRTGPRHGDLSSPYDMYIEPVENEEVFNKPIVILTNRATVSAGEMFTLAIKALPNATQIGDSTRGGVALLYRHFVLPNGWTYHMPTNLILNLESNHMENIGVVPDIYVRNTEEEIFNDFDRILEYAIEYTAKK